MSSNAENHKWAEADVPDQSGRVAVVTGANTGIGYHTAAALAYRGAHVVLAVRDLEKGNAALSRIVAASPGAPKADVTLQALDLTSLDSVRTAADALRSSYPRIDLLINNAGVMLTPKQVTKDGFELQFGTNHLGHFALTGLLLDHLLPVRGSRVVTVSSMGHRLRAAIHFDDLQWERSYNRGAAYGQSKLANLLFTYELQRRLSAADKSTIAVAAHPGSSHTELTRNLPRIIKPVADVFGPVLFQSAAMGALPTLRAATDPAVQGGQYYGPDGFGEQRGHPKVVNSSAQSHDEGLQRRLWTVSEELTGVKLPGLTDNGEVRSVEEHQRVVAEMIRARPAAMVPLAEAQGLVLADDVVAQLSLPVFDNSAMDGYAVRAEDAAGATPDDPVLLPVAEDIPAGRTDQLTLQPGTAHRIMTGAPVPAGATGIVPVEATDGGVGSVAIREPPKPGKHIRLAGEDVAAGTTVLRQGQLVTPAILGLAAALGMAELPVLPRQRVLVISTGSELVTPGSPLRPGQIYESNAVMLAAAVRDAGATVIATATASDDVGQFSAILDRYAADADLIITSGGVSAGAYEVVKDAFGRDGEQGVEFVKVAMQPGMPQGIGRLRTNGAGATIVTLPGNPVSSLVSFEVFIRPALRTAMGLPDPHRPRRPAVLTEALTSPRGKRQFRRAILDVSAGTVTSYGPPASHHLRWLASANGLLDIPEDVVEVSAGTQLQVWDLT